MMRRPTDACDVFVIGAGPAGSACAASLARSGFDVILADKAAFPRDKLCGDFVTPGSVRLLESVGLAARAREASPSLLRGMRLTIGGHVVTLPFPEGAPGWAIGRRDLDASLVAAAREAGARFWEGFRADSVVDEGGAILVSGRGAAFGERVVEARLAVEAGGRNALSPRARGWRRPSIWPVRYAVGAWFEGVRGLGDHGEMHVLSGGYLGVSPIGRTAASAAAVVDARLFAAWRRDAAGLLSLLIRSRADLRRRFEPARRVTPVRGAGPLAHGSRRFGAGRLLVAGDAAAFVDPFTGEGIQAALSGGVTAARFAASAIAAERAGRRRRDPGAAAAYEREIRRALAPRFALSRALQALLASPPLARRVAAALERRRDLAASMVAVTGGLDHPSSLLSPAFAGPLLQEALL